MPLPLMQESNDPVSVADALAKNFALTAVARDRQGGTPKAERDAIRQSGLLGLVVPRALGGLGASWQTTFQTVRAIARADGSVAHVYGFQHLLLATVRLFGGVAKFEALAGETAKRRLFWGNALNPLDTRAAIVPDPNGADGEYIVRGEKSFCSGARDADMLIVSALDPNGKLVIAAIPADRPGITAREDWDNMGQRQTDSGSVVFDGVRISKREILADPGPLGSTYATLRPLIAQISLINVYLGIAEGALAEARTLTRERGKGWFLSGIEQVVDDPYVLATFGDLVAEVTAARHSAEAAARALDTAWSKEDALTTDERGALAVAVAAAKITATRAGLEVTTRIFDATGARATTARLGLDRYWRNLRTHTLHDPVDYKKRDLGRWYLTDALPKPSFYS